MTTERSQTICPNCNANLETRPQRKKKCPACGNFIYVKTLPKTREKVLVTESQAKEIEAQWSVISANQERENWLAEFNSLGISEIEYYQGKDQLSAKLGREANTKEVAWALFNKVIASKSDLQFLKMTYYRMALFLDEESKDPRPFLEKHSETELMQYKQSGVVKKVSILAAGEGDSCSACQKQNGKTYTIEEALRLMPIPCKNCTKTLNSDRAGFCRCCYVPSR